VFAFVLIAAQECEALTKRDGIQSGALYLSQCQHVLSQPLTHGMLAVPTRVFTATGQPHTHTECTALMCAISKAGRHSVRHSLAQTHSHQPYAHLAERSAPYLQSMQLVSSKQTGTRSAWHSLAHKSGQTKKRTVEWLTQPSDVRGNRSGPNRVPVGNVPLV
jgi:hypothetical protein